MSMMTMNFSSPPAFDYSSRDFQSIREELIALVQTRYPDWNPTSAADFGVVMLEAFAYIGDNLSYYLDRMANESSIITAVQPENVFAQAALLGYTPALAFPAYASVTFTNNGTGSQTIAPGTQVVAQVVQADGSTQSYIFETEVTQTLSGSGGTDTIDCVQGVTYNGTGTGEVLGISDGSGNQQFLIPRTPVIDGSTRIIVNDGVNDAEWTYVSNLYDYGPGDLVFGVRPTAYGQAYILFGDGAYGAVPTINYTVKAIYRIGGGVSGNVGANTINQFNSNGPTGVVLTNTNAAVGGADAESLASIRQNAPKTFAAVRRGVTMSDYEALATNLTYIAKANAMVSMWSAPTVYVAPPGDGTATPGRVSGVVTTSFAAAVTNCQAALQRDAVAGATVMVTPASYAPFTLKLAITLMDVASRKGVAALAKSALVNLFSYANSTFAHTLNRSEVLLALSSVPGVMYADITDVYRNDSGHSSGVWATAGAANEILTLNTSGGTASGGNTVTSSDLVIVLSGGIADL